MGSRMSNGCARVSKPRIIACCDSSSNHPNTQDRSSTQTQACTRCRRACYVRKVGSFLQAQICVNLRCCILGGSGISEPNYLQPACIVACGKYLRQCVSPSNRRSHKPNRNPISLLKV